MALTINENTRGIIFDLDGTLIDSMPVHKLAWKEICATQGFEFTDDIFYKYAGVPSEQIFEIINEEHGTNFDPYEDSKLKEKAYRKRIAMIKPINEVIEIVKTYYNKLPMSIGTGSPRTLAWEALKSVGLDHYFDILVSKQDVENGKPAPDTFLKCASLMNVKPEYCQVFEDGEPGLEAAKAAGMIATDIRSYIGDTKK